MAEVMIAVAQVVPVTEAEGPGKRFALWVQGCPLRCPGCCNPEMLPFVGGTPTPTGELIAQLADARDRHAIEGLTLLGGEPFAHAESLLPLTRAAHELGLSVMIFTGFTIETLRADANPAVKDLLSQTDILVDGPYLRGLPETTRRWLGSANQRVHFLSMRCEPNDPRWRLANTLEIRLRGGEITINGFPARGAAGLWRRIDGPG